MIINIYSNGIVFGAAKTISFCNGKTNTTVPATKSKNRNSGAHGDPKLSNVALELEKVLQVGVGKTPLLQGKDDEIYSETENGPIFLKNGVFYNKKDRVDVLMSVMLMTLTSKDKVFEEIQEIFKKINEEYLSTKSVSIENVATFCDSFYYSCKKIGYEEINMKEISDNEISEVQQGIESAYFSSPEDFSATFKTVKFENVEEKMNNENVVEEWYEKSKNGEYVIPWEWSETQKKNIKNTSFLDGFIPGMKTKILSDKVFSIANKVMNKYYNGEEDVIGNDYFNTLLVGKPGTGKTATAQALSAILQVPIYEIPISKNTEEGTFEGLTKVSQGTFDFKETPFLEAYKNGGIVVLEEFNLADPAVLQGALGQAIEKPFILMEDGYKPVKRHPLFFLVMTMNTGLRGTKLPNDAFTSRAPLSLIMEDVDKETFVKILQINTGAKKAEANKVYKFYLNVLNYIIEKDASFASSVTMRHCIECLNLIQAGLPAKEAMQCTFVGSIAIKDLELANDVYENVIKNARI